MPKPPFRAGAFAMAGAIGLVLLAATGSPVAQSGAGDPNLVVNPALFQELRYRTVGPARGGRVTAVAGHHRRPSTFFLGATGGGVWRTADAGITWENVSDGFFETASIGAIAVAESDPDVVYVGTGSACIRSNVIQGRGVYKSSDGGKTWRHVGLRDSGQIGALVVHPGNAEVAYVAALGQPFGPNSERGVFRTTDGGKSWTKVLYINDRTGAVSVAMDVSNPRVLYAGAWRGERRPWTIISGGPASEGGVYKTTDGGDTWGKLSGGLPQTLIGKLDVTISRSRPERVYVLVEAPGDERGVYRSDDGGATFVHTNQELDLVRRPFYYTHIHADPRDPDVVYVNNEGFFRSSDGGKTFVRRQTPHGDNHAMWINPDDPRVFVQGNDGGANVTLNGGESWSSQLNQLTAELYQVETDDQFPYRIYGAQQDTGAPVIVPSLPPMARAYDDPVQMWVVGSGCETGPVKPKPGAPHVLFGVCKGEFYRMNLQTGQEQGYWVYPQNRYGHAARDIAYRFQRVSPFEISPHDPEVIYHGSHVVHRTRDGGRSWDTISPDLTANEPDKQGVSGEPITRDITGEEVYSAIYAIEESPIEAGVIWVGANDGPVHVTRDAGKTWTNVTPSDLPPGGRVQNIEPSPHRKGSALIAVYRYLLNDYQPYVYATHDYGATWRRLTTGTNGVPRDFPTRVVREDPDREGLLYVGTEFGMFVSFDGGAHWQSFQLNLPVTPVTDIKVFRNDLVLSTMGRSFWVLDNVTPLHQIAAGRGAAADSAAASGRELAADGTTPAYLFAPRPAHRLRYVPMGTRPGEPQFPPPGAAIDYYFGREPAGEVTLEIVDADGGVVRRFSSEGAGERTGVAQEMRAPFATRLGTARLAKTPGMHRLLWDFRHEGASPTAQPRRGSAGPLAPPGRYSVRLKADDWTATRPLELKIDPRLALDGITERDLVEQRDFLLKIRDAQGRARTLADQLRAARDQAGIAPPSAKRFAALYDRLVTAGGSYPQPMIIDQFANIARMLGEADQKVGRDAYARFDDLLKQLTALESEARPVLDSLRR